MKRIIITALAAAVLGLGAMPTSACKNIICNAKEVIDRHNARWERVSKVLSKEHRKSRNHWVGPARLKDNDLHYSKHAAMAGIPAEPNL